MKKGISELISAALLLAITISVAGVYLQWAPEISERIAKDSANKTNNQIKCQNAAIDIKNVEYDRTASNTTFDLENKGTISFYEDLTVAALNSSGVTGRKDIKELQVEETETVELNTGKIPDEIIGSSQDCPELNIQEDSVNVTR